jgi:hypothetical protein
MMKIYPIGYPKYRWSFRSVFVFLNKLLAGWAGQRPSCRSPKISHPKVGDWILKPFYADDLGAGGRRVTMKVDNDWNLGLYRAAFRGNCRQNDPLRYGGRP